MSCSDCPVRNADSTSIHLHLSVEMTPKKCSLIAGASLFALTIFLPGGVLLLVMIYNRRSLQCEHSLTWKEFTVWPKTNEGQKIGLVTINYRRLPEAQRDINILRGSLWLIGKMAPLNGLLSRKENMLAQKSQALKLWLALQAWSRHRSILAPGENLMCRPKLPLSHRPSLRTITLEISHHKSMNTSNERVLGATAGP